MWLSGELPCLLYRNALQAPKSDPRIVIVNNRCEIDVTPK